MPIKIKEDKDIQVCDFRYDEGLRGRVEESIVPTITTRNGTTGFSGMPMIADKNGGGKNVLKIRKLTPKECIRLMGFTDEDYEAMRSIGMSDSAIYHMAGDSIVVTVLISIFSQLMFEDDRHKKIIKDYISQEIVENTK